MTTDNVGESPDKRRDCLCSEFALALRAGNLPSIEDYLGRVPEAERADLLAELICEEHAFRWKAGDLPTREEYVSRFPDYRAVIDVAWFTKHREGGVRYALVAKLGAGAFGTVFRAKDTELDRAVAIKVLNHDRLASPTAISRFEQEIQLLAKIECDGVVRVYDYGRFNNNHRYVVMQFVNGQSLRDVVRSNPGGVQAVNAAKIMQAVGKAVDFVHRRGAKNQSLVHCDLKPENILLTEDDNPHVADFGLAAGVADLNYGVAWGGGTIPYMSPEQVAPFRPGGFRAPIDTRSDIWALGVILFELLSGEQPFISKASVALDKRDEIVQAILSYEPPQLHDLRPDVPRELEKLVGDCLKKSAAERPKSAADVATRLRHWLDSVSSIPVPLDFSTRIDEARQDFVDRPWLFDELDAWPEHCNERMLVLTGELGSGKSAFLAEFVHRNPQQRILGWHYCRQDWPDTRRAAKFVRSLAGMLAANVASYRSQMESLALREALRIDNCEMDPASSFETAVVTPLAKSRPPGDGIYFVVVDALDEADLSSDASIAELLATWQKRLPDWLRIVVSARRNAIDDNLFAGIRTLVIDRDNPEHVGDVREDILRFLRHRLNQPNLAERLQQSGVSAQSAVDMLFEKSEANFLYVAEALTGIERDLLTFQQLDAIPPGLRALYDEFFRRQWPNRQDFALVRPVLEVLAAAQEPLTEGLIAASTGLAGYELEERLTQLAQYLERSADRISLRHRAIMDWLTTTNGIYRVVRPNGEAALAKACREEYGNFTQRKVELSDYCVKHLPHHLTESEIWKDLVTLLTDLAFLQAKVERGFLFDLIRDCTQAAEKLPTRNTSRDVIRTIADVLTRHAAFLGEHQDHLFQCFYNDTAPMWDNADGDATHSSGSLNALVEKWRADGAPGRPWVRMIVRPEPSPVPTFHFHAWAITAIAVLKPRDDERELVASCAWDGSIAAPLEPR